MSLSIIPEFTSVRLWYSIFKLSLQNIIWWWQFWCSDGWIPESITKFGWLTKIRSMQLEECCKICVGSDINWFNPNKEVTFSSIVPSSVVVSLIDHDFDLALKSLSNTTIWGWQIVILFKSFSKLLIKDWNSSDV